MRSQKTRLLFTIAAILLAGLACRLPFITEPTPTPLFPFPDPPLPPTASPPTDSLPTLPAPTISGPPPTATPVPPPPAADSEVIPHYQPGDDLRITEVKILTLTDGWAIGRIWGDEHDHILYTRDGGKTWQDVTPPEPNTEDRKRAVAFFHDPTTAWVTYAYQESFTIPSNPVVWRTTDSGQFWAPLGTLSTGGTGEFFYPDMMTFANAKFGWLTVSLGGGMSHDYTNFYRTTDGGKTWEEVHNPSESVHLQECCKTGMSFGDPQTGLITHGQGAYAGPYVQLTRDGGLTWERQFLTLPPELAEVDFPFCDTHSPHIFSGLVSYFAMTCEKFTDDGGRVQVGNFLYASTDGGQTWQVSPYPGGELHMYSFQQGYAAGTDIYHTNDGGQTWDYQGTYEYLSDFHFINSQYGWAIGRYEGAIYLFGTQDSGATWRDVFPVIGP